MIKFVEEISSGEIENILQMEKCCKQFEGNNFLISDQSNYSQEKRIVEFEVIRTDLGWSFEFKFHREASAKETESGE